MLYKNYELFESTTSATPEYKKVCECRLDSNHSSPKHNYPNELKRKYYDYPIGLNNETEFYSYINNNNIGNNSGETSSGNSTNCN